MVRTETSRAQENYSERTSFAGGGLVTVGRGFEVATAGVEGIAGAGVELLWVACTGFS